MPLPAQRPSQLVSPLWKRGAGGDLKSISRLNRVTASSPLVVPASTTAAEVLEMNPDGIFLSNGPGDPEPVTYAQDTIKELIGKKPIFGICLGHQLTTGAATNP